MNQYKDTYEDLLKACNKLLYEQSSKVSTICRTMVYALFTTIWAVTFSDGHFNVPDGMMLITLLLCVAFLLLDISHYFADTCFSYHTSQRIFKQENQSRQISYNDAEKFAKNSKRSFRFLVWKFILTICTAICFAIAVIWNL